MSDNQSRVVVNIGKRNVAFWSEFLSEAERIGIPRSVALERGARLWLDQVRSPVPDLADPVDVPEPVTGWES